MLNLVLYYFHSFFDITSNYFIATATLFNVTSIKFGVQCPRGKQALTFPGATAKVLYTNFDHQHKIRISIPPTRCLKEEWEKFFRRKSLKLKANSNYSIIEDQIIQHKRPNQCLRDWNLRFYQYFLQISLHFKKIFAVCRVN